MTDIYEKNLIELTSAINLSELICDGNENPNGAVMSEETRRKIEHIRRIGNDCSLAAQMKDLKIEFSNQIVSWVKTDMKTQIINEIAAIFGATYAEKIYYNMVFCIIERWGFRCKCQERWHLISKDKFCELVGINRKTLSNLGKLKLQTKHISQIWASDETDLIKNYDAIRNLLLQMSVEIQNKITKT